MNKILKLWKYFIIAGNLYFNIFLIFLLDNFHEITLRMNLQGSSQVIWKNQMCIKTIKVKRNKILVLSKEIHIIQKEYLPTWLKDRLYMKNILCKIRVMKVQINLFKIRKYFQGLKIRMDFSRKFIHLDGI